MYYLFSDERANAESAYYQLQALQWLIGGSPMQDAYELLYGRPMSGPPLRRFEATLDHPTTWAMRVGGELHILLRGCTTPDHFRSHDSTWRDSNNNFYFGVFFTKYHYAGAASLMDKLEAENLTAGVSVIRIVGHSLGGATAAALACLLSASNRGASVFVHTMGSPACVWVGQTNISRIIHFTRWFGHNDCVPNLPPQNGTNTLLHLGMSAVERANYRSWRHPCPGYQLGEDGAMVLIVLLTDFEIPASLYDVAGWLYSWTGMETNNHSIVEYKRRLNLQTVLQETRVYSGGMLLGLPQTQPAAPTPRPITPSQVTELVTAGIANSVPPVPPHVIGSRDRVPKPWTRVKTGYLWTVYHNGVPVGVTNRGRDAYNTVVQGNQLDRAMAKISTMPNNALSS